MGRKRKLIGYCRDHAKLFFIYCERCLDRYNRRGYSWGEFEARLSIQANLMAEYKKYKDRPGHHGYAKICHNLAQQIRKKEL